VFIIPRENRNCLGFCSVNSEAIVAACPEPIPGRKEHRGAKMKEEREDLKYSLFERVASFRRQSRWGRGFEEVFIETAREDNPKSPERRGRRGCSTGRLNVRRPRTPERRKIVNERKKLSSLKII